VAAGRKRIPRAMGTTGNKKKYRENRGEKHMNNGHSIDSGARKELAIYIL